MFRVVAMMVAAIVGIATIATASSDTPASNPSSTPSLSPAPPSPPLPPLPPPSPSSPSPPIVSWRSTLTYPRNADPSTYRRLVTEEYERRIRHTMPRNTYRSISRRFNLMTYNGIARIFNNCTIRYAVDRINAAGAPANISLQIYFSLREWNHTNQLPVADRDLYRHSGQWSYYDADLRRRGKFNTNAALRLRDILNSVYTRYESVADFDDNEHSPLRSEYRPHPHDGYILDLSDIAAMDSSVKRRIVAEMVAAQLHRWFAWNPIEEVKGGNADWHRILREYAGRCSQPEEIDLVVSFEPSDHRPVCTAKLSKGALAHASFSYLHLREDLSWVVAYSHLSDSLRRDIRNRLAAVRRDRGVTLPPLSSVKPRDIFLEHVLLHELGHFYGLQHKYSERSDEDIRWRERYRPYSIMYPHLATQFLHISLSRYDSMLVSEIGREITFWRDMTERLYDKLLAKCRTDTYDGLLFVLRIHQLRELMARARDEINLAGIYDLHERAVADLSCSTIVQLYSLR